MDIVKYNGRSKIRGGVRIFMSCMYGLASICKTPTG